MNGYIANIEKLTLENQNFRQVLYTAKNCQLVVMSILPGEDIGAEVHTLDQFIRIEQGSAEAILDGAVSQLTDGSVIIVPAGAAHNIINTGDVPLKLYTVYAPPNHRDGVIHVTKADAEANEEHFDGVLSE